MENVTHSLLGATLAELALPTAATPNQRRLFMTAGIIAANLPDADLLYTRITAPPLGYLLHHRGHTHTVAGLVALALVISGACLLPTLRDRIGALRNRFAALVALALASHLVLDAWNSYGVHPFWPVDNGWFYGDAINIVEPFFWLFMGVAVVINAPSPRTRVIVGSMLGLLTVAAALVGMIGTGSLIVLALGAFGIVLWFVRVAPRTRAIAALLMMSAYVNGVFFARNVAERRAVDSLPRLRATQLVDVVLSSRSANPLCWTALAITKDESAGEFVMTSGSVPVHDAVTCRGGERGRVAWERPVRQSLVELRTLAQDDCWVRAWMQFGRAPLLGNGEIGDMRFGGASRGNFSAMPIGIGGCPSAVTSWGLPRADLL